MFQNILKRAAFPVLMFGSVGGSWLALSSGYSPLSAGALAVVPLGIALVFLEQLIPYSSDWNRAGADLITDIFYLLANTVIQPFITLGVVTICSYAGALVSQKLGIYLWPNNLAFYAQLCMALLIKEFFHYWLHRLAHEGNRFLWAFHSIHHSVERLYWLNSMRLHVGNLFLDIVVGLGPLILLGAPEKILFLVGLLIIVVGMLAHANVDFKLGPLNWIFSMSELHRWHHSLKLQEANSNYGAVLIVWDIVFGTRRLPEQAFPPNNLGIASAPTLPNSFWKQLLYPFRR